MRSKRDHSVTPETGAGLAVRLLEVWEGQLTRRSGVGGQFFFCESFRECQRHGNLKETHQLFWRL